MRRFFLCNILNQSRGRRLGRFVLVRLSRRFCEFGRCLGLFDGFAVGQRGGIGGKNFHPAVHPPVRHDEGVGPQGQAHLTHGFSVGTAKESTYVHVALPPMMAVILRMRSSGISALDNTPICGR